MIVSGLCLYYCFLFLSHYHYHYPSCHSASHITDHSHHCWRHYNRHSCYHQFVFVSVFIFCCISHFPIVFPSIHSIFRALFDTATCFNKPQRWCQWVDFTLLFAQQKMWYTHTIPWDKKRYIHRSMGWLMNYGKFVGKHTFFAGN